MNIPIKLNLFFTDNFALATTLATVGVPWADPNLPCSNTYDVAWLREKGLSAEQATKAGHPGKVQWGFQRTPECEAAIELFHATWNQPADVRVTEMPEVSTPDMVRIIAQALKNRARLGTVFKEIRPRVAIPRGPNGEVTIISSKTDPKAKAQWGLQ